MEHTDKNKRIDILKRLPQPVGRTSEQDELQAIYERVAQEGGFYVVVVTGPGGIGKTFLLEHMRRRWEESGELIVPQRLIDLYDTVTHAPEGFWDLWIKAYSPEDPRVKVLRETYDQKQKALQQARLSGEHARIQKAYEDLANTLRDEWQSLAKATPWVAILDTAERWVYPLGDQTTEYAPVWKQWWLPWLQNAHSRPESGLLIFVGRPQRTRLLAQSLKSTNGLILKTLEIKPLSVSEIRQYLAAYDLDDLREDPENVHRLTKGYPIRLTLFAYLYKKGSEQARQAFQTGNFQHLIDALMNESPWSRLLPILAVAERGLTPRLAALLDSDGDPAKTKYKQREFERDLAEIAEAVFIKTRRLWGLEPAKQDGYRMAESVRYFLHDEMYDWVRRSALPKQARVSKWLHLLSDEALKQLRYARDRLGEIYLSIAEKGPDADQGEDFLRWEQVRQQAELDRLAYLLRANAHEGLRQYVRLVWEAHALYWDNLIRAIDVEALEYLRATSQEPWFDKPTPEMRTFLETLRKLQPAWEAFWTPRAGKEDLEHVRTQVNAGLKEISQARSSPWSDLLEVWLRVVEMEAQRRAGGEELQQALQRASELSKKLDTLVPPLQWNWYRRWVAALLERVWAYLHRTNSAWEQAIRHFDEAVGAFDRLPARYEQAVAANDGGFVLVQQGRIREGEEHIREAFSIRRRYGWALDIALSLNTLAHAALKEGRYHESVNQAKRALNLLQILEYTRGIGFAHLVISEANRRLGDEVLLQSRMQQRRFYEDARHAAERAREIFSRLVQDWPYEIRAHDEAGRVYRQLALWHLKAGNEEEARSFVRLARGAFMAAIRRAGGADTRQGIISRVNLFALEAQQSEDPEALKQNARQILRAIEKQCPRLESLPDGEEPLSDLCKEMAVQKGKTLFIWARALLHLAAKTPGEAREKLLREAGERFVEALEFSRLPGESYPTLRLAREQLVDDLRNMVYSERLSRSELEDLFVASAVKRAQSLGRKYENTYLAKHVLKELRFHVSTQE